MFVHDTSEAPPQTDKHVDLSCFTQQPFRMSAAQGKNTCGFLASLSSLDRCRVTAQCLRRGQKTGSACVHEMEGVKSPPWVGPP